MLPGTYTESDIVVNKPLKLKGSGLSGTTDTLLVPEIASARAEQEFPDNSHQGIIIYAPSVTVSLFHLDGSGNAGLGSTFNYHQGITTLYDQQNPGGYHDYVLTRGRGTLHPIQLGPRDPPTTRKQSQQEPALHQHQGRQGRERLVSRHHPVGHERSAF